MVSALQCKYVERLLCVPCEADKSRLLLCVTLVLIHLFVCLRMNTRLIESGVEWLMQSCRQTIESTYKKSRKMWLDGIFEICINKQFDLCGDLMRKIRQTI